MILYTFFPQDLYKTEFKILKKFTSTFCCVKYCLKIQMFGWITKDLTYSFIIGIVGEHWIFEHGWKSNRH